MGFTPFILACIRRLETNELFATDRSLVWRKFLACRLVLEPK